MKIVKIDKRNNFFEVIPDNLDDLWHLERIIEPNDIVSSKTERKIKPKEEGMQATKESVYYEIQAEKIEFHESSKSLRILGVIVGGKPEELVELKAHHSIDITPEREVKIQKTSLKNHQIDRLKKAEKSAGRTTTLVVMLDDEAADIALLKDIGFELKAKIPSGKSGKQFKTDDKKEEEYFKKIVEKIKEISAEKIIFAGPGFTKNNLKKYLNDKRIKLHAFFEHTDETGVTGLNQLLREGTLEKIVTEIQAIKETLLVEKILEELGKNGLAVIGEKDSEKALHAGAVSHFLISDKHLLENRKTSEEMLSKAEEAGGEIHILNAKSDAGKKIHGFGGIACLIRYRLKY